MFYLHLSQSVTAGWLIQTGCQGGSADSSACLVCQGRWDQGFSHKVTLITAQGGEQNMVAPWAFVRGWVHLLNSNASFTSELKLLWVYTKQNICHRAICIKAPLLPVWFIFTVSIIIFKFHSEMYCASPWDKRKYIHNHPKKNSCLMCVCYRDCIYFFSLENSTKIWNVSRVAFNCMHGALCCPYYSHVLIQIFRNSVKTFEMPVLIINHLDKNRPVYLDNKNLNVMTILFMCALFIFWIRYDDGFGLSHLHTLTCFELQQLWRLLFLLVQGKLHKTSVPPHPDTFQLDTAHTGLDRRHRTSQRRSSLTKEWRMTRLKAILVIICSKTRTALDEKQQCLLYLVDSPAFKQNTMFSWTHLLFCDMKMKLRTKIKGFALKIKTNTHTKIPKTDLYVWTCNPHQYGRWITVK